MRHVQVPRLDQMDASQAQRFLSEQLETLSPEQEYALRHDQYVMDMPQSGERIVGRDNMRAFQEAYPNPPKVQVRRVLVRDGLWVIQAINDYGGHVYHVLILFELRDGKIWRDTRFYAEPFEAPVWRAKWVERFDPAAMPS